MAHIRKPKFKAVTPLRFWTMVNAGYTPPRHCFLIMKDGNQDWGYPITEGRTFDHHRQGVHHNQSEIAFILLPK